MHYVHTRDEDGARRTVERDARAGGRADGRIRYHYKYYHYYYDDDDGDGDGDGDARDGYDPGG